MRVKACSHTGRLRVLLTVAFAVVSAGPTLASLVTPVVPTLPTQPTIASTDYNLTIANSNIDGGAVISPSNTAAQNAAVINAAMSYISTHGGGVLEIPPTAPNTATTYLTNAITVLSNVNMQIDGSTTLKNGTAAAMMLTSGGNALSNFALTGSGSIDGGATTKTGSDLIDITKLSQGLFSGVTIANSGLEHLVVEASNNITINGITINDKGTLAANHNAYLGNTDGIDYNGSDFLIENNTISDGDDDIVCKSGGNNACAEITVENNTIHAGHGISVGGGTSKTLTDYLITGNTFNPIDPSLVGSGTINTITYGLRLKAGDVTGGNAGGLANNLTFSNNTLTNVQTPIAIESFYNGSDLFPSSPIPGQDTKGATPAYTSPLTSASGGNIPYWENVLFSGDTITGATNAGLITGLSFSPANIQNLEFDNTTIQAASQMDLWYAANVDLSGLTVTVPTNNAYYGASPVSGVYLYGVSGLIVPEPSMMALGMAGVAGLIARRRRI